MFENSRPLPWSARRYRVTEIGEIIDADGNVLPLFSRDAELFVRLTWLLGDRDYKVSLLVLVAYGVLSIPDHLLDEVVPLYRDGSPTNLSPVNLLYKFKSGKIEVEDFPGFYYIPFYADYAINQFGDLINISTGKHKSWSVTKPKIDGNQIGGYRYSRVINDLGFSKCLFQHRALCYVFKDYDNNVMDLVTNHIDGNPENNSLDNLELVTYQRNNVHAVETGLRGDNKPVLVKDLKTGNVVKFSSIAACGRHYGQPRGGFVQHRLKYGAGKLYPDFLQIKYDDGTPWPIVNLDKEKIVRDGIGSGICARNVFTGDVIIFRSADHCEQEIGVKAATILSHARDNKVIPIKGWNFRWKDDTIVWPSHSEKHLKVYRKFPTYPADGANVFDVETNKERFFESVSLACADLKINRDVFYQYSKTGKLLAGKYNLSLFRLRENLCHPAEKSV